MDEMKRSSFFIQTIWKKSVIWYIIFLIDVSISYVSQPLYFSNGVKKKIAEAFGTKLTLTHNNIQKIHGPTRQ